MPLSARRINGRERSSCFVDPLRDLNLTKSDVEPPHSKDTSQLSKRNPIPQIVGEVDRPIPYRRYNLQVTKVSSTAEKEFVWNNAILIRIHETALVMAYLLPR